MLRDRTAKLSPLVRGVYHEFMTLQTDVRAGIEAILRNLEAVIVGKRAALELAVSALLADGHLLIRDVPGVGKTMLARALAVSTGGIFKRIQCTPDLLPSDITGGMVYDARGGALRFVPGPVFANVVLADELNRATPRTQAAFLEAMDERQVTIEGAAHPLPTPFFLIATSTPLEQYGTYPLPEGQLDRFLASASLGYPSAADEVQIIERAELAPPIERVGAVCDADAVLAMRAAARAVRIDRSLVAYAVDLAAATRTHSAVELGVSPRGSQGLTRLAQAWALVRGRGYVLPDDLKHLAPSVFQHRLLTRARTDDPAAVIDEVLARVPIPGVPPVPNARGTSGAGPAPNPSTASGSGR
ncbi:MAG TPA: MoxR family ATPase [bacterium]|nr:MoxR family ATPase [bacterium]